jgi:hypothetical protein
MADSGPPEQLRHLGDVAEHVGQVADPHRATERFGGVPSQLEVPDQRLARDEELVHEDLPRPDRQPALADQALDPGPSGRPDLEVVVDRCNLAVERESEPLVRLHRVEELVDQLDETHPEHLEGLVPLTVPVGVGDQVDDRGASLAGGWRRVGDDAS